jgi:signal transduction histidine kinase/ligand-binding sensor domain-containing protein/CheY-like chemotaxis protein/AraC-like DNA-binding protein
MRSIASYVTNENRKRDRKQTQNPYLCRYENKVCMQQYPGKLFSALGLILCFLLNSPTARAVYFKHIGMNDGLSHISVMSIYQDQLGRMWFGTREGISLYDGERMRIFKDWEKENRDERMNNILGQGFYSIVGNKEGDVFLSTPASIIRYDMREERFYEISSTTSPVLTSCDGKIWVAQERSIYTYDEEGDSLCLYLKTDLPAMCLQVSGNKIWIGTTDGLYVSENRQAPSCVIEHISVYRLFESSSKELWAGTLNEGLYRIPAQGEIKFYSDKAPAPFHIASSHIREFAEDKYRNIWFGTFNGLHKYNPNTDAFTVYQHDYLPGSLSHSSVFSLFIDSQETIWAGTYYGGVNYFNIDKDIFTHYVDNPSRKECLSYPFVGRMVEDKDENIWICTEGGGLNLLDKKTRTFTRYKAGTNNALLHNNLKAIAYDKKRHHLYIGTHYGGLSRFDISNGRFHNYLHEYADKKSMPYEIIHQTLFYNDKLYASSTNGLFVLNPETDTFQFITHENVLPFAIDSKGYIWAATEDKLSRINPAKPEERTDWRLLDHDIHFGINAIMESSDGDIYFVTGGSGLYRYDTQSGSFIHYSKDDGALLSNYCYNLVETRPGELLITSDKGVTFFNPSMSETRSYKLGAHLPITSITDGCGVLVCTDNELFIGGSDGLTSFRQEELLKKEKDYSLHFSELYIHNARIYPGSPHRILKEAFPYSKSVTLKHNQNNLIITFASTNYIEIQKSIEYEYRLAGFDTDWVSTSLTGIYYTNLNPGKYKLLVREKSPALSPAAKKEIALDIIITPPWYNTAWAWFIYITTTSAIAFFIIKAKNARRELALSLVHERAEKERNEELNQAKLRFFTNISHEFKTPLTLILSQIETIFQHTTLPPAIYNKIIKINRNASLMRNMIVELLEFHKLENNHVSLQVYRQNIIPFLKDIYLPYCELATQQIISFQFQPENETVWLWFDPNQLQKVFNNLLYNAFKYTKKGGSIEVLINETETEVSIKVIDSGIGISGKDASQVFNRFYQASTSNHPNPGTGIGLALSKNIVTLHHGTIAVMSELGYGSIFTVTLRKGKAHFEQDSNSVLLDKPDEPMIQKGSLPDVSPWDEAEESEDTFTGIERKKQYTVLLVEDNDELLQILNNLFTPLYKVVLAHDGEEGLRMAHTANPDLIVSDVMMPLMSGIEMCSKIKNSIELCHIPVVLLTALDAIEHNMEGLQQGADDYIRKPFHAKALLMRCNNLIKNRLLIKAQLSKHTDFDMQILTTSPLDQKLISHILEIMEKNMSDPAFDVNVLARELCLGRTTLFSKFKSLTGMTPNEFIQNQRIKHAAKLLLTCPDMQIAEIAEQSGFESAVYFSRCFKSQFGSSPLQFRKEKR